MKTLHETKYQYIGTTEVLNIKYHMFQSTQKDFDPEILLVTKARLITKNNESIYFDEIK